ncbi:phage regulatory protein, rha family [Gottschalkia purinilytica]|uniref:Phage regulatory protein, rha family n=1 Tax=Gottschalkia purinilytica TaxID=1503 RepID=A0A0L0WEE6_GOTPU|nr:Rha family transcriptional regulator [Gottschalkia purinilytica]KNF09852.1 phage regulatory protein, rha family [Gottschalkia purinilytica]
MNNLINIQNQQEELTLSSREVAEMVGKRHDNLIRDIENYVKYLTNSKLRASDFFVESTYVDSKGEKRPCYEVTRKGCEFIAHKLTGQKGSVFTATYINRFHEMEDAVIDQQKKIIDLTKQQEVEARLNNSKVRQAKILLQIAEKVQIPEYKQILHSKATEIMTGEQLLPLPKVERETLTAEDIGKRLGISANMVGRLANKYNLKTDEYGIEVWDKSRCSNKQVASFRYYDNVLPIIRNLI